MGSSQQHRSLSARNRFRRHGLYSEKCLLACEKQFHERSGESCEENRQIHCWLFKVKFFQLFPASNLISRNFSADWTHRVISNPLWLDALEAGRKGLNCESRYKTCAITESNMESFTRKIQEKVKSKKTRSNFG